MKTRFSLLLAALCGLINVVSLHAQTTAFTYQGRLTASNAPADGRFDFEFNLFGAESGGTPVSGPLALPDVGVTNGIFTLLLDFGAGGFTGADRWLDIAVRPAGSGAFTALSPRQPITPAPYAIHAAKATELASGAVVSLNNLSNSVMLAAGQNVTITPSGNTLTIASPTDGIGPWQVNGTNTFYNAGKVGVGTTLPASKLHVTSGVGELSPPRLQSGGGSSFNAGWDFYPGGIGKGYVGVPDSAAAFAQGEMLVFGGPGVPVSLWAGQTRALTVMPDGDVQLGASGQFHATSGEENLRIVRGVVNPQGAILAGAGFTVSLIDSTTFDITFNPPFAGPPAVTATAHQSDPVPFFVATTDGATRSLTRIVLKGGATPFHFIAIGPR